MATLAEIYDWFMTGKKPTQAQFWAAWGSTRLKGESIPQSDITNLSQTLNAKAEKTQFDAHKTDPNAHSNLILKARIYPYGQMQVFKVPPNENVNKKEVGDYCIGMVQNTLINGNWNGADESLKTSYE